MSSILIFQNLLKIMFIVSDVLAEPEHLELPFHLLLEKTASI
jgi:hypothetical protein